MVTSSTNNGPRQVLVDPRFALEWRDISDFLGEFGPHNGRYVPRYPNDWNDRLRSHFNELTIGAGDPVKGKALKERVFKEAPLCTVPVGWKWEDHQAWSNNVENVLPEVSVVIVIGDALDPTPFSSWTDAIDDIRGTRRRTWPYHGTISEYVEFCRPLLVNSPAAYLIDPYLDPFSDVAENLIRSLFSIAKGSRCYSIEIITRRSACAMGERPDSAPPLPFIEIDNRFKRTYRDWVPKDRHLKLHLVDEGSFASDALRLHDRFFLTTHGSLKFGQGFVLGNKKLPQQNAFVVERDHHIQLKQTYIDGVARYRDRLPRIAGIPYPIDVNTTTLTGGVAS